MVGKILLTLVVVAALWFGFRAVTRIAVARAQAQARVRDRQAPPDAQTMVECPVCGLWQPTRTASPCGRRGCPY